VRDRANQLTVAGLVLTAILQIAVFAFYYGQLAERVDNVKATTDRLLQLQLEKQQAKGF
jgi:hypothetical protein